MYHLEGKKYLLLLIILYLVCRAWFAINLIMPIINDYNHQLTVVIYRVWKIEGKEWLQSRHEYACMLLSLSSNRLLKYDEYYRELQLEYDF